MLKSVFPVPVKLIGLGFSSVPYTIKPDCLRIFAFSFRVERGIPEVLDNFANKDEAVSVRLPLTVEIISNWF